MALIRPIFIIGTGRCGSTIFHDILAHHSRLAYLSGLCVKFPLRPHLNRWAMHLLDVPFCGHMIRRKLPPVEAWAFWEEHCRGFRRPSRDLLASDLRPHVKVRLNRVLQQMVTKRRARLLVKLTGWPRTGFLAEAFPDALFVHILRDGRAVANSLLDSDYWLGYQGPGQCRWGNLDPQQQREWEETGKSFVALAGIQWKILMDAFKEARDRLPPAQYLQVNYDDFIARPHDVFGDVLSFCDLDFSLEFKASLDAFRLESANFKWKKQLTNPQQKQLEAVLADDLVKWGIPL